MMIQTKIISIDSGLYPSYDLLEKQLHLIESDLRQGRINPVLLGELTEWLFEYIRAMDRFHHSLSPNGHCKKITTNPTQNSDAALRKHVRSIQSIVNVRQSLVDAMLYDLVESFLPHRLHDFEEICIQAVTDEPELFPVFLHFTDTMASLFNIPYTIQRLKAKIMSVLDQTIDDIKQQLENSRSLPHKQKLIDRLIRLPDLRSVQMLEVYKERLLSRDISGLEQFKNTLTELQLIHIALTTLKFHLIFLSFPIEYPLS